MPTPADELAQLLAALLAYRPQLWAWPRPRPPWLPHPRRRLPRVRGVVRACSEGPAPRSNDPAPFPAVVGRLAGEPPAAPPGPAAAYPDPAGRLSPAVARLGRKVSPGRGGG